MATDFIRYRPLGGVNREDSEGSLGETECRDSQNFLFEQQECRTRPGVAAEAVTGLSTAIVYGNGLRVNDTPYNIVLSNGKLYRISTLAATEITGSGLVLGSAAFHNSMSFNGVVIVGNNTGGLVRWDTAGNTYTIVSSSAKYRYFTSHYSRLIGAYKTDETALIGPRTVGWCKTGDETVWTGSTNGSGSSLLSDANDEITQLGTLHNVVVVARRTGFHLGFPTGVSQPAFRWEKWSDKSAGCYYPGTWAVEDNVAFFCGRNDVFTFDLEKVSPIGGKIRKDLCLDLAAGVDYRGFVSKVQVGNTFRTRYNLVPLASGSFHYVYDIETQTWSKHLYAFTPGAAWNRIVSNTSEGPTLANTSTTPNLYTWNSALACESQAFILSPVLTVAEIEKDYTVHRALIRSRDRGIISPTLTVYAVMNNTAPSISATATSGTVGADGKWKRSWVDDVKIVGQEIQVKLDLTTGGNYSLDELSVEMAEGGKFRGGS